MSWYKLLDPEILRGNLNTIGVYLVAFELLKSSVIERPRGFFLLGIDELAEKTQYHAKVLIRDKSPFRASLLWFKEMGAITDEDMTRVDALRQHRNSLVHEIPRFLSDPGSQVDIDLFGTMLELLAKIDRWWIRQFEIELNPALDHVDPSSVADVEIASGNMIMMQFIIRGALGDLNNARSEFESFRKVAEAKMTS